ncbi:MAG: DASH complex subunit dam1 [Chrysothrix sp. TS-e1954]|nr:MAG: DASH complex subunit dam1 [Chrysothrix sp. TS-e1954]
MSASTPQEGIGRSSSRNRAQTPPPRPTTPLRPPSRNSLRSSQTPTHGSSHSGPTPIESLESQFAEVSDGMADLEANFMHLQLMHESLARFSECFAAFLHGLKVNAFCVDFPEAPIPESFRRARDNPAYQQEDSYRNGAVGRAMVSEGPTDPDQTFLYVLRLRRPIPLSSKTRQHQLSIHLPKHPISPHQGHRRPQPLREGRVMDSHDRQRPRQAEPELDGEGRVDSPERLHEDEVERVERHISGMMLRALGISKAIADSQRIAVVRLMMNEEDA